MRPRCESECHLCLFRLLQPAWNLSTTLRPDLPSKSPINYSLLVLHTHCPVQCVCSSSTPVLRFFTPPRRHQLGPWPPSPGPRASPRHSFETRVHRNELDPGPHPWCDSSGPWPTQSAFSSSTESVRKTSTHRYR